MCVQYTDLEGVSFSLSWTDVPEFPSYSLGKLSMQKAPTQRREEQLRGRQGTQNSQRAEVL